MKSRQVLANAIRILSVDSIQAANSGHPGAPMGMADVAEVLWRDYMNHNPCNPNWVNRDRFVLSNGHSSMLLYSILHLTGYNLSIEDLKNFRQLNSKTPGHPECDTTDGVETTTGPLGQGMGNAVGLAISERTLAAQFNQPGYEIINHYTYVFLGDGCMMEGISHEACSLAGNMKLGKLVAFYDDNGVSIDGDIKGWFNDDTAKRFEAYGWHVVRNVNGHDSNSIILGINQARSVKDKPSLLICKTIIGYGAPNKSGTHKVHGAPLGEEEVSAVRQALDWNRPPFIVPVNIYQSWNAKEIGTKKENIWNKKFAIYEKTFPKLANELKRRISGKLPEKWLEISQKVIYTLQANPSKIATRKASQNILEVLGHILPELLGGSSDLTPSNLTKWSKSISIVKNPAGNYIHYGAREFGMTAIGNGIARYGGFIPYTATFLMFSEYARNAIRMAALMSVHHIMIYTHDSIAIGEDGPTHQPIEQLSNLRTIPNMRTWRPCDQVETAVAWKKAIEHQSGPTALILSRQPLVQHARTAKQIDNISKGGYILRSCDKKPELILISTGSEMSITISAYQQLAKEGWRVNVVSMPSPEVFDLQDEEYRESVLPKSVTARLAIEAGTPDYWYKYVGLCGCIIGVTTFGKSGSTKELLSTFGLTIDNILIKARMFLK